MSIRRTPVQPKEVAPVGISFDSATGLLMTASSDILDFSKPATVTAPCDPVSNVVYGARNPNKKGSRSTKILSNRDLREKMMLSALNANSIENTVGVATEDVNTVVSKQKQSRKKLGVNTGESGGECEKFCQCKVPLIEKGV